MMSNAILKRSLGRDVWANVETIVVSRLKVGVETSCSYVSEQIGGRKPIGASVITLPFANAVERVIVCIYESLLQLAALKGEKGVAKQNFGR